VVGDLLDPDAVAIHESVDRKLLQSPGMHTYELTQTTASGIVMDVQVCKSTLG
jgi:hypothetical protein